MSLFDRFKKEKIDFKDDFGGYYYMDYDELMNKLAALNFQWRADFEQEQQELIGKIRNIEHQLSLMKHIGIEILEDAPLTGTVEERKKKLELEKQILDIKTNIVKSFKESIEMTHIPLEKKRFLYGYKEDWMKEEGISREFDADLSLNTPKRKM